MKNRVKKSMVVSALCMMVVLAAASAFALTTPANGAFGYDAYDLFVNKGLQGPFGFVIAAALVAFGAYEFRKNPGVGIASLISSGVLVKADSIVSTLGMII